MFGLFCKGGEIPPDSDKGGGEKTESTSAARKVNGVRFNPQELKERIIDAIRSVYDPEIPVNVYDLGLIYDLQVAADGAVRIHMTLTAPGCPVAGSLPAEVERAAAQVPGVGMARVELVWDPPWSAERMSEEAKLELGLL